METLIGFVVGYLAGSREGSEGLARVRSSWQTIRNSPEVRRLAGQALSAAEMTAREVSARGLAGVGGTLTRTLADRAAGGRQPESRAA